MRIGKPRIVEEGDLVRLSACVEYGHEKQDLWYSVERPFAELLCGEAADPFVVGLLLPAMYSGEEVVVEGEMSEKLYCSLQRGFQAVVCTIMPSLRSVVIRPNTIQPARGIGEGVATGFSGGVDSFCVLADYWYSPPCPAFRITHLLYHNVGSHGVRGRELFTERFERLRPFAEELGLPFVAVDSNLDEFYKVTRLSFQQTHTVRNVSAALALQGGIGKYLYASAFAYPLCFVGKTYDIAYADPILLPLLSTEVLEPISVGGEYSRVEKTLRVANIPDSYLWLDVCARGTNAGNCSTCWKCLRTELTLEIAGKLDLYRRVFDLRGYQRRRAYYIGQVLSKHDPLVLEIRDFAKANDFRFPLRSRVFADMLRGVDALRRLLVALARSPGVGPALRAIYDVFQRYKVIGSRRG